MTDQVVREGFGLHGGKLAKVVLSRAAGDVAVTLRKDGHSATVSELRVVGTDRATTLAREDGAVRVATVEHLFAALAGHGVRRGLVIDVEGDELPLLDGAAAEWSHALSELGLTASAPSLGVLRDGEIKVGKSRYVFRTGGAEVKVTFETNDRRLAEIAAWTGAADDFVRIAPARTFAFAREMQELVARGLASHVAKESVVVIAEAEIHSAGPPFSSDEPARHKLLDLLGDLYVHGGPPRGSVHAVRPGHAVTHTALARALADGILGEVAPAP